MGHRHPRRLAQRTIRDFTPAYLGPLSLNNALSKLAVFPLHFAANLMHQLMPEGVERVRLGASLGSISLVSERTPLRSPSLSAVAATRALVRVVAPVGAVSLRVCLIPFTLGLVGSPPGSP